jgi:hypothetical protein
MACESEGIGEPGIVDELRDPLGGVRLGADDKARRPMNDLVR